ncbi:cytochrome c family protein [Hasllibacter sp. MH4015]|uniref:c-type cytochrome n=1 Tax=Hasllibacter sp. MH4015 TaxID=2854029 RepID=UPI001CD649ED|nr:c-type cytochrome [Hasllibacter sp. MH4015]
MFDTMTITKAFGALCGALLVLLLGGWAAEGLYNVDTHGEDHVSGYRVVIPDASDVVEAEAEPEVPFEEVFAAADAIAGERLWRQCSSCHALNAGQNGVGPYLVGVVGRDIAAAEGFDFSDALASLDGVWEPERLSGFLENPRTWAPGTAMSYGGMDDIADRANLIAYLATQQ